MFPLIMICLQSALLMAAAYGLQHQYRRLQTAAMRERALVRRLDDQRQALHAARSKHATLDRQRAELAQQLARESSLRVFAEARLRTQQPVDDILLTGASPKRELFDTDVSYARAWRRAPGSARKPNAGDASGRAATAGSSFADTLVLPL